MESLAPSTITARDEENQESSDSLIALGHVTSSLPPSVASIAAIASGELFAYRENVLASLRKSSSSVAVRNDISTTHASSASLTDDLICRYCGKIDKAELLVAPCKCRKRSTLRWAHVACVENYMNKVHSNRCDKCKHRIPAIAYKKSKLAWLRHKSTRPHQYHLLLTIVLSATMIPVLCFAWVYVVTVLALQESWIVTLCVLPCIVYETSTWLGFAGYSFWIYYAGMKKWIRHRTKFVFKVTETVVRPGMDCPTP
ncbi:uncharacterized protein LOC135399616 isoform X2 [Ornithodoros turicata]|uniref:uncharacterized protein LOC135399616 isoform X2 n=1 Tax=Ornithodoros turicata TaxID=34597 RepID=UPI003138E602